MAQEEKSQCIEPYGYEALRRESKAKNIDTENWKQQSRPSSQGDSRWLAE